MPERGHAECVEAWLDRAPRELPPEQRILRLERTFTAVWRRAAATLGEVTLTAILDRVLHDVRRRSPVLAALALDGGGIRWEKLRALAPGLDDGELREASRLALVELLTVLGRLTAEILTPALHAELLRTPEDDEGGLP